MIAEGVESEPQLQQLRKLGCEHVQGYLLCRPLPADEIGESRFAGDPGETVAAQAAG